MNWLFPGFLAGGLLIGLPVLLHFLRSKPKTIIRFPSLRFLGETAIRDTRKHRLRRWLTLALRTLIIAALAAAFARPFWKNTRLSNRTVMLIAIDNSMSMQASGRWEKAREWALSRLDSLEPGDQAGLLLINPSPSWMVPFTEDLPHVRAALQEMQPGFETTHYPGALRMAGEALNAHPARTKTLVWMADEQRLGWLGAPFDQQLPAGVKIMFGDISGEPARQAAITSAHWASDSGETAVEVNVRLFAPDKETRRITVQSGGKKIGEKQVELKRGETNKIRIPLSVPADMKLDNARISMDPDDLPADDVLWLAGGPKVETPVLFTPENGGVDYMTHALTSTQKLQEGALKVGPYPAGDWPSSSLAIVTGSAAFDAPRLAQLDRFATAGGALWIFMDGSASQTRWLKEHGVEVKARPAGDAPVQLHDWDSEHPSLKPFANESLLPLMEIEFYSGYSLEGDKLTPVAKWPDGATAIAEWNSGGNRMLLCGFPLDRGATNWFVQPSFVPFVHQAARWLSAAANARNDWHVGDTIPVPASGGTWRAIDSPVPVAEKKVTGSVRPDAPGLYEFSGNGERRLIAVNVPPAESDLSPWPDKDQLVALESKAGAQADDASSPARVPLSDELAESQQRLWWWVLVFGCVAMMAELALANRTAL